MSTATGEVGWFRDLSGGWRRVEPWMSTIVNAASGQVLGIVDGRDSATVGGWLAQRSPAWRARIDVVAIDPSAAFKKAISEQLPNAQISVDPFHLLQLAYLMLTRVRQRLVREREQRRRRKVDPAWHTELYCSAATTRCLPVREPGSRPCSPATTPPMSCRPHGV